MAIPAYFFICALPLHHPFLFLLYPLPLSILQSYTVPQYGHTGLFCLLCTFLRLRFRIPFSLDYKLIYLLSSIFLFRTWDSPHAPGAFAPFPRAVALRFMSSRRACAAVALRGSAPLPSL